jgi:hypothetical protein
MDISKLSVIGVRLKGQPGGYYYLRRMENVALIVQPAGQSPAAPVVLTTDESNNAPLNIEKSPVLKIQPFVLLDLR